MAQYPKSYFIAKFIANYAVTHQDMQDLVDSALFYSDDIGYDTEHRCYIAPQLVSSDIIYNSLNLLKLPNLTGFDCVDFEASSNILTSFIVPDSFISVLNIDFNLNKLTSFSVSEFSILLQTLILNHNLLTTFICHAEWTSITTLDLSTNTLTSAAMDDILIPLAASGAAVAVDVSGGTNAAKSTWSAAALAAEATIITNGGSVTSNP